MIMKKFIIGLLLSVTLVSAFSQPVFINRNPSEQIVRKVTTTNATATTVYTVAADSNEVGFIKIKAIGFSPDSVAAVTGIRTYRYTKVSGTLTLGSVIETQTPVADTKVSGTTFAASAVSNDIAVKVTGKADVTMYWNVVITQTAMKRE